MKRFIEEELIKWKDDSDRKPLILSGARQVGKSYVIERNFSSNFDQVLSINFEKQPEFKDCFESDLSPGKIIRKIEALSQKRVDIGRTLVFLDEIQICPKAITALRYFYEELPALHLIAAGSLLEFTMESISVPVGRVTYRHLTPLSFEEFLYNSGNEILLEEISRHNFDAPFDKVVAQKAEVLLKEYMAIGGMPQVVDRYIQNQDYLKCQEILSDLLETYTNDFPKYGRRDADLKYIDLVFARAAHLVGKQFKYVHITRDIQSKYIKQGVDLLVKAGVLSLIYKTYGSPLGANYNPHRFKLLFLDIGLMQRACGLNISRWVSDGHDLIHAGVIAEQFVGQEIAAHAHFKKGRLYYWERDKRGSSAELDYLVEMAGRILPVEVKSGTIARLKSLQNFLKAHPDIPEGIKVSLDNSGKKQNIRSIPLYAFGSWLKRQDYTKSIK